MGCQATSHILGDIEYKRTLKWNLVVISYHIYIIYHIYMIFDREGLMNGLGQLSNPNRPFKLVLMRGGKHQKLFRYCHYLGQVFYHILFLVSIFSNIEGKGSHLYHNHL